MDLYSFLLLYCIYLFVSLRQDQLDKLEVEDMTMILKNLFQYNFEEWNYW